MYALQYSFLDNYFLRNFDNLLNNFISNFQIINPQNKKKIYIRTGLFIRPTDENNLYTTLEPTMSSNPNVYFQRGGNVHPGMMY